MEPAVSPEVRGDGCFYVFVHSLQIPELSSLGKGCVETVKWQAMRMPLKARRGSCRGKDQAAVCVISVGEPREDDE